MAARKKFRPSRADRQLVPAIVRILNRGCASRFEFEGAARHGLRSAFCLLGESWTRSDARAAFIVRAALRRIGAQRPSWQEGQPEYTQDGYAPVLRWFCAKCGELIPQERQLLSHNVKFCSNLCQQAAIAARKRQFGYAQTRAEFEAMLMVRRADALRYRGVKCLHCGELFMRSDWRHGTSRRYCSKACYQAELAKPRSCVVCGSEFQPVERTDAIYCSPKCKLRAWREREKAKQAAAGLILLVPIQVAMGRR